jgi:hypothetical protein
VLVQSVDQPSVSGFAIAADDTSDPGRRLRFQVSFSDAAGYFSRDTVDFYARADGLASRRCGNRHGQLDHGQQHLNAQTGDPAARSFFSDSPNGLYPGNSNRAFTTASAYNLSTAVHAYLDFMVRWEFEGDYDAGVVEANLSGNTWTLAPARASVPASPSGAQGNLSGGPVFEGAGKLWRPERVDLSAFAGPTSSTAKVRFRTLSDTDANFDGFRVDSLRLLTFNPAAQPAPVAVESPISSVLELAAPAPNPTRAGARLAFTLPTAGRVTLEVLDLQGRRVRSLADGYYGAARYELGWDLHDARGRRAPPGLYLLKLSTDWASVTRRLMVL